MEQISPQPMVISSQSAIPAINLPPAKPPRKNWRIVIIIVISTILALVVFGLAVVNQGLDEEKPDYFNKIKVGRTTSKEVRSIYGKPVKITSLGGVDVYLYPSTTVPFMHQVMFSRSSDKVLLVNEFVGGSSGSTLNDFIKRYHQYDRELFTVWGEDSRVYIFSKPGLLLHVDAPSGRVIEIGYFSPGRDSEVMQIMGKYLLNDPPER